MHFLEVTLLMYIYAVTGMELIRVEPDLALDHPRLGFAAGVGFAGVGECLGVWLLGFRLGVGVPGGETHLRAAFFKSFRLLSSDAKSRV